MGWGVPFFCLDGGKLEQVFCPPVGVRAVSSKHSSCYLLGGETLACVVEFLPRIGTGVNPVAGVGFTSPRMVTSSSIWWLLLVRGLTDVHCAAACDFLVCSNRSCLCFSSSFFFFFASLSLAFCSFSLSPFRFFDFSHYYNSVLLSCGCLHFFSAPFSGCFSFFFAFSRRILSSISSSLSP